MSVPFTSARRDPNNFRCGSDATRLMRILRTPESLVTGLPARGHACEIPKQRVAPGVVIRAAAHHVPRILGLEGRVEQDTESLDRQLARLRELFHNLPCVAKHLQSAVGTGAVRKIVGRAQPLGSYVGTSGVARVAPRVAAAIRSACGLFPFLAGRQTLARPSGEGVRVQKTHIHYR